MTADPITRIGWVVDAQNDFLLTPAEGVPVTAYGVGSSLLGHAGPSSGLLSDFDFTADLVKIDGEAEGKVGRSFRENPRLVRLDWSRALAG